MTTSLLSCVHFSVFAYTNYHFLCCKQLVIQHLFSFSNNNYNERKVVTSSYEKKTEKKEAKNPFEAHPRIDNKNLSQIHNNESYSCRQAFWKTMRKIKRWGFPNIYHNRCLKDLQCFKSFCFWASTGNKTCPKRKYKTKCKAILNQYDAFVSVLN